MHADNRLEGDDRGIVAELGRDPVARCHEHKDRVEPDDLLPCPAGRRPEIEVAAIEVAGQQHASEAEPLPAPGEMRPRKPRRRNRIADPTSEREPRSAQRDLRLERKEPADPRRDVEAAQSGQAAAITHRAQATGAATSIRHDSFGRRYAFPRALAPWPAKWKASSATAP